MTVAAFASLLERDGITVTGAAGGGHRGRRPPR